MSFKIGVLKNLFQKIGKLWGSFRVVGKQPDNFP